MLAAVDIPSTGRGNAQPCVSEQPCMQGKGVTACLAAWVLLLLLQRLIIIIMLPNTAILCGINKVTVHAYTQVSAVPQGQTRICIYAIVHATSYM
jgi:hypothetical protein